MAAGLEIERKFLVTTPPEGLDRCESSGIRQGYLSVGEDRTEVRLRNRDGAATLTVKQGRGRVRVEEEVELDADAFERLWRLTEGARLEKRRYLIPLDSGLTAELDVFGGDLDGLMVAEVEFPDESAAERFEPPPWLDRELTDDPRFSSQRLAVDGMPDAAA